MKVIVLNENSPGVFCGSEHGLSYIIEADKRILFDAGPSDIFLKNAQILNQDIKTIDTVVLSHGHWDHGNGLMYLKNKTLITHPMAFKKRYRNIDNSFVGLPFTQAEAEKKFNLVLTKQSYRVSDDILFLGEIPRKNDFEGQVNSYHFSDGSNDPVSDDSAILVRSSENEWILITACSHSGICNILNYAQSLVKESVVAVIGGFHLKKTDEKTARTIQCLKSKQLKHVIPSHCTTFDALIEFRNHFEFKQLKSGDILEF